MFESPYIKIDEHGINLIKNYQVAKHIEYHDIQKIELNKKGYLINNWILSLILALSLSGIAIVWGVRSAITFDIHSILTSNVRFYLLFRIFIPLLLFIGSMVWIYLSLKRSTVIYIITSGKKYKVAMKEFEQNDTLQGLVSFLSARVELLKL